jgi:hypothetical protein
MITGIKIFCQSMSDAIHSIKLVLIPPIILDSLSSYKIDILCFFFKWIFVLEKNDKRFNISLISITIWKATFGINLNWFSDFHRGKIKFCKSTQKHISEHENDLIILCFFYDGEDIIFELESFLLALFYLSIIYIFVKNS